MARRLPVSFDFNIDKPIHQLKLGERVRTGDGRTITIVDFFTYQGRKIFVTDIYGLVNAEELVFNQ